MNAESCTCKCTYSLPGRRKLSLTYRYTSNPLHTAAGHGKCEHEGSRRGAPSVWRAGAIFPSGLKETLTAYPCKCNPAGVQVTAGLVRQLEGRSSPDPQPKPVRRAGPAWMPHLRPAGYSCSPGLTCFAALLVSSGYLERIGMYHCQRECWLSSEDAAGLLQVQTLPMHLMARGPHGHSHSHLLILRVVLVSMMTWRMPSKMSQIRYSSKHIPGTLEQKLHLNRRSTNTQIS